MEKCFCIAILEFKISQEEFLELTPYDFSVLLDYHGRMKKDEYQILRNTIYNAGINLMRKKNQKEIPLFSEDREKESEDRENLLKEREALFGEVSK